MMILTEQEAGLERKVARTCAARKKKQSIGREDLVEQPVGRCSALESPSRNIAARRFQEHASGTANDGARGSRHSSASHSHRHHQKRRVQCRRVRVGRRRHGNRRRHAVLQGRERRSRVEHGRRPAVGKQQRRCMRVEIARSVVSSNHWSHQGRARNGKHRMWRLRVVGRRHRDRKVACCAMTLSMYTSKRESAHNQHSCLPV